MQPLALLVSTDSSTTFSGHPQYNFSCSTIPSTSTRPHTPDMAAIPHVGVPPAGIGTVTGIILRPLKDLKGMSYQESLDQLNARPGKCRMESFLKKYHGKR